MGIVKKFSNIKKNRNLTEEQLETVLNNTVIQTEAPCQV